MSPPCLGRRAALASAITSTSSRTSRRGAARRTAATPRVIAALDVRANGRRALERAATAPLASPSTLGAPRRATPFEMFFTRLSSSPRRAAPRAAICDSASSLRRASSGLTSLDAAVHHRAHARTSKPRCSSRYASRSAMNDNSGPAAIAETAERRRARSSSGRASARDRCRSARAGRPGSSPRPAPGGAGRADRASRSAAHPP